MPVPILVSFGSYLEMKKVDANFESYFNPFKNDLLAKFATISEKQFLKFVDAGIFEQKEVVDKTFIAYESGASPRPKAYMVAAPVKKFEICGKEVEFTEFIRDGKRKIGYICMRDAYVVDA